MGVRSDDEDDDEDDDGYADGDGGDVDDDGDDDDADNDDGDGDDDYHANDCNHGACPRRRVMGHAPGGVTWGMLGWFWWGRILGNLGSPGEILDRSWIDPGSILDRSNIII